MFQYLHQPHDVIELVIFGEKVYSQHANAKALDLIGLCTRMKEAMSRFSALASCVRPESDAIRKTSRQCFISCSPAGIDEYGQPSSARPMTSANQAIGYGNAPVTPGLGAGSSFPQVEGLPAWRQGGPVRRAQRAWWLRPAGLRDNGSGNRGGLERVSRRPGDAPGGVNGHSGRGRPSRGINRRSCS